MKSYVLRMAKPNPGHGIQVKRVIDSVLRRYYSSRPPIEGGQKGPEFRFQMDEQYEPDMTRGIERLHLHKFRYELKKSDETK